MQRSAKMTGGLARLVIPASAMSMLVAGCTYDPITGTYALDTKALELISNIAVSSLANSMAARGDKDTIDRAEARAVAFDSQSVLDPMQSMTGGSGPWPIDAQGQFGAYTCGGQTYWVSAFVVKDAGNVGQLDEMAAQWTADEYATENSLGWDGTPYRFELDERGRRSLVLLRYNATTNDIGWVRISVAGASLDVLANDGAKSKLSPEERSIFRWEGESGCDVTLFLINTSGSGRAQSGGVFWFD